jgi:hypothetical protein
MVSTIVLLSWLLTVREKKEWNRIKNQVHSRIKAKANELMVFLYIFSKNGIADIFYASHIEHQLGEDYLLSEVTKQTETQIQFDEIYESEILKEDTAKKLLEFSNDFNSIVDTYFRFLSPEIIQSIMNIQNYTGAVVGLVEENVQTQKLLSYMVEDSRKKVAIKALEIDVEKTSKERLNHVSIAFNKTFVEIAKINKIVKKE